MIKNMTKKQIEIILQQGENSKIEFKKRINKELASEICAFSNSQGGVILLGVDDNNIVTGLNVDNTTRSKLETTISAISPRPDYEIIEKKYDNKNIVIIDCKAGKNKPYIISGSIYVRYGANSQKLITSFEMREFFQQENQIFWEKTKCEKFSYPNDFDNRMYEYFINKAKISKTLPQEQIIKNLDLTTETNDFKSGAVLFFGKNPENFYKHIGIRCILFKGNTKRFIIDDKLFTGNLFLQYENANKHIQSKLETRYEIESQGFLPRKEILEIPEIAIKECLINALSHRDYYAEGAIIHVEIFDNRVEITNPGGLVPQIKENEFGKKSFSRNSLIFSLFQRMDLVEKVGTGIPRINKAMINAGLFEPEYSTKGFFTVKLFRPIRFSKWLSNLEIEISNNQENILSAINENPKITYTEISQKTRLSNSATIKNMKKLKELNLINRKGSKTKGFWRLNTRI